MMQMNRNLFLLGLSCALAVGCSDDDDGEPGPSGPQAQYVMGLTVQGDPTIAFVKLFEEFPSGSITLDDAIELGATFPYVFGERVFSLDRADGTLTRFRVEGLNLVQDGQISFAARGGAQDLFFISETRAFAFNEAGREFVEFDPSAATMAITASVSVAAVDEAGFGMPTLFRRAFVRQSDNTIFSTVNYPLAGPLSIDDTFLLATNVDTATVTLIRDERCPVSLAFGINAGFFNANDDFFFLADASLGLPALLGAQSKDPCIIRIPAGTVDVDPDFQILPRTETNGRFVVGLVPLGGGLAFTNAYDLTGATPETALDAFATVEGQYWLVDTNDESMRQLPIPEAQLAVNGFSLDGRAFVIRSDSTDGQDGVEFVENVLIEIDAANGTSTEILRVPANLFVLERLR